MGIYIFLWIVFSLFSCAQIAKIGIDGFPTINRQLELLSFLLLFLVIGFRWETGTDWEPYFDFFQFQKEEYIFSDTGLFEPGYVFLNRLIGLQTDDYAVFVIIHALIFLGLLFISFKHFAGEYLIMAIFLYFSIFIGMTGSNRQLIAVVIGLYGVVQLSIGKSTKFFLCVILAFLFHTTALLLIIYYFINRNIKPWLLVSILVLSVIIGYSSLPTKLFSFAGVLGDIATGKVESYSTIESAGGSVIGLLKRIILSGLFIYLYPKINKNQPYFKICLHGYLTGVSFFFLFRSVPVMGGRAILYFNIMEPILMIYLISLVRERAGKLLIAALYCLVAIFYFIQSINEYPSLFIPYKGLWINETYQRIF